MKEKTKRRSWSLIFFVLLVITSNLVLLVVEFDPGLNILENADQILFSFSGIVFALVGGLILLNQRRHRIGWLLMVFPLLLVVSGFLDQVFYPGILETTDLNTSETLYVWFGGWSWWLLIGPIFLIFLLFPTGQLISLKWRRAVILLLGTFAYFLIGGTLFSVLELSTGEAVWPNPIGILPLEWEEPFLLVFAILLISTTIVSVASIFVRYRRSDSLGKAQLRWLFYATAIFLIVYTSTFFVNIDEAGALWGIDILFSLSILLIPIAIGIAVLRYRLWDIDFVINRSLVFGVVTTILAGIFAFTTSIAAQLAKGVFGEEMNQAAAAVAAIVVASVFQPVRTRVEAAINRRLFPENVDLSEGLVELNPDLWHWIDLPTIMDATLKHLQEIYHYDVAAIYMLDNNTFLPVVTLGIPVEQLQSFTISPQDQKLFDLKKGVLHEGEAPFVLSVPVFLKRRKTAELIGILRLGKRPERRSYSSNEIKTLSSFGGRLGEPFYALGQQHK